MRELFLQIVYGRTQSAFSEDGLAVGASLEDLGKGLRSQVGTMFATAEKGPRYLEMAEGYCSRVALNKENEIVGYEFINRQDDGLHQKGYRCERSARKGQGSLWSVGQRCQVHRPASGIRKGGRNNGFI